MDINEHHESGNSIQPEFAAGNRIAHAGRILFGVLFICLPVVAWLAGEQSARDNSSIRESSGNIMLPVSSLQLRVAIVPLYAPGEEQSISTDWFSEEEREMLLAGLSTVFPFTYEILPAREMPGHCINEATGQYRTDKLLLWLRNEHDGRYFRSIGLTTMDVTAPGRNFLFGQAQIGGSVCVASHIRLTNNNAYSRERQRQLWHQIIQHELGHTLGLPHIEDRRSLMCYANSLAEHAETGDILLESEWELLESLHNIDWVHED